MKKLLLCGLVVLLLVCIVAVGAYVPSGAFTVKQTCDPLNNLNEVVCNIHGEYSGPEGAVEAAAIVINFTDAQITQISGDGVYSDRIGYWIFPNVQNEFKTDQTITFKPELDFPVVHYNLLTVELASLGTTVFNDLDVSGSDPNWAITSSDLTAYLLEANDDSVVVWNCVYTDPISLGANDHGSSLNPIISVEMIDPPQHGSAELDAVFGKIWLGYYPYDLSYWGEDSLKYRLFDGNVYSNIATVTIQKVSYVGGGDTYYFSTPKDTLLSVPHDNQVYYCNIRQDFTGMCRDLSGVSHGQLNPGIPPIPVEWPGSWDGSFDYMPDAGFTGSDQFTYTPVGDSGTYGLCLGPDNTVIIDVIDTTPPPAPAVSFNEPDTALCQFGCYNPKISAVVSGLNTDQKVDLQLTYQILHPSNLQNQKMYITLDNVGNGEYPITPQMFEVDCLWPGIPPESEWPANEEKVMEIHFGANLLDSDTGNCITQPCTTGSQDYYWYPWVCGFPPVIPEFPSTTLPVIMIIGFLGAVLFIQRTKEN